MPIYYKENNLNVHYISEFYNKSDADTILKELLNLPFKPFTLKVWGKKFTPRRKMLAFGDAGLSYSFCGISVPATPWTPLMEKLKTDVEKALSVEFNYVLLNFYPDGKAKIGHHKDDESSLDLSKPVSVLSFGAQRTIEFKRSKCKKICIPLQHGSMYTMYLPTNKLFTHGISVESTKEPRISLTFRKIILSKDSQNRKSENTGQCSAKKAKNENNLHSKDIQKRKLENNVPRRKQKKEVIENF